jgi:hypothetical protein
MISISWCWTVDEVPASLLSRSSMMGGFLTGRTRVLGARAGSSREFHRGC